MCVLIKVAWLALITNPRAPSHDFILVLQNLNIVKFAQLSLRNPNYGQNNRIISFINEKIAPVTDSSSVHLSTESLCSIHYVALLE